MATLKTVILIPALNEAETISDVVSGVREYGTPLVVSDGSTDDTAGAARAAGAEVLELPINRGYEGALDAGFAKAAELDAEIVITFDADGQFNPKLLGDIQSEIAATGVSLVFGVRPTYARIGECLFGYYTRIRYDVRDILCGVKAYPIALYLEHGQFDGGRSVGTELALAALRRGDRFVTIPAEVRPRQDDKPRFGSGWRGNKRILIALLDAVVLDLRHIFGKLAL